MKTMKNIIRSWQRRRQKKISGGVFRKKKIYFPRDLEFTHLLQSEVAHFIQYNGIQFM